MNVILRSFGTVVAERWLKRREASNNDADDESTVITHAPDFDGITER